MTASQILVQRINCRPAPFALGDPSPSVRRDWCALLCVPASTRFTSQLSQWLPLWHKALCTGHVVHSP